MFPTGPLQANSYHIKAWIRTGCPAGLGIVLLCFFLTVGAQEDPIQLENKEVELESIRSKIRDVQSQIDAAQSDTEVYLEEIQAAEKAATELAARLRELEEDIHEKTARLQELEEDKAHWEGVLDEQRGYLARQVRSGYMAGHHDFLKLLLNQEDPALLGRIVSYHEYHNRARAERIQTVKTSLQKINDLEKSIKEETARLKELRGNHMAKLEQYNQYRQTRRESIDELQNYIDKQGQQLQHLQQNEKELAALLSRLKSEQLAVKAFEELPPFDSLKGKLSWPVDGRLLNRFGEARGDGRFRSHGVRIAAENGDNVRAVSGGKVIFADWFRNMGLLMIIDHGNGFMSLYGNNERLLKKPGDMVHTNEVIAKVGDTGGRGRSGVYFEIRRQGDPLNPALWCRR